VKQQIVVSGIGGQGVLFLTRFFAEVALEMGLEVLTSEIHGMAMRGGTVLSHVKVGAFKSPLIRPGQADAGVIVNAENLALHGPFIRQGGVILVNTPQPNDYLYLDADGLAKKNGFPGGSNLLLVGYGAEKGAFFCDMGVAEKVIAKMSGPAQQAERNLASWNLGRSYAHQG
jgi:indolepyruvate ferredoxin oxidoreductase, beta subunit